MMELEIYKELIMELKICTALIGANCLITLFFFLWNHSQMRSDMRHMETQFENFKKHIEEQTRKQWNGHKF